MEKDFDNKSEEDDDNGIVFLNNEKEEENINESKKTVLSKQKKIFPIFQQSQGQVEKKLNSTTAYLIPGLHYIPEFITVQQQKELIIQITKQKKWNTSLKRRTQHYGFQYSYDRKKQLKQVQEIPEWTLQIKSRIEQLIAKKIFQKKGKEGQSYQYRFDQMIINQYQPGQGINPHTDDKTLFSDVIVSLSLGSECVMVLSKQQKSQKQQVQNKQQKVLQRRSIIAMYGEARYDWKHSIPARKKDNGQARGVRYSLTFRKVREQKKIKEEKL